MTDLRKAANMALHALEFSLPAIEDFGSKEQLTDCHRAIMALYKSLAQPEQKPVAWMMPDYGDVLSASEADGTGIYNVPLYTAPQKYCPSENNAAYEKGFVEGMAKQMHSNVDRAVNAMAKPWVGLTEDELKEIQYSTDTQVEYVTYDEGEYGTEIDIFPENFAYAIEAKLKEKNNAL